jgi:dimethylargininase
VTALPDGTVVGFPPDVDDRSRFPQFLAMPEAGAAVVPIDDGRVLMADSVPRSVELLRGRGLDVVTVPITEFEKLEGCVTCLSVRIPAL